MLAANNNQGEKALTQTRSTTAQVLGSQASSNTTSAQPT